MIRFVRGALGVALLLLAGGAPAADVARGETFYRSVCATCHNPNAFPGPGPIQLGINNPAAIAAAIMFVPEMAGLTGLFTPSDLEDIAAYLGVRFGVPPPPPPPPPVTSDVVEYYHAAFDHYFITALPTEIMKLDDGTFAGWARTGRTFKVYGAAGDPLSAVCRFFSAAFAPKSSHFYTALASECATVKGNADWTFEDEVFFVATPAADGTCAAGTMPVYRLYNDGRGGAPNHRFTTDLAVRADMLAQGWIPEGQGVGVTMCVPP